MEATVSSRSDDTIFLRRFVFSRNTQTAPQCCAYSQTGDRYPCCHGVSVIFVKRSSMKVHRFIDALHLTAEWKAQYYGLEFPIFTRRKVYIISATTTVEIRTNTALNVPVAICPPRWQPPKQAPDLFKYWCKNGLRADSNKRKYHCSLCGSGAHTARSSKLLQFDAPDGQRDGSPPSRSCELLQPNPPAGQRDGTPPLDS